MRPRLIIAGIIFLILSAIFGLGALVIAPYVEPTPEEALGLLFLWLFLGIPIAFILFIIAIICIVLGLVLKEKE